MIDFTLVYLIGLGLLLAIAIVSLIFSFKRFKKTRRAKRKVVGRWLKEWLADTSGELVGVFIATLVFGLLVSIAQISQQESNEKARLVSQFASKNNTVALAASADLSARGWLRDGTLRGRTFIDANFQGLSLELADLEGSFLSWVNMRGASLNGANLKNTYIFATDLCGASLAQAHLQNAKMEGVDLRESNFFEANLQGTNFHQSDLRGAFFLWALFNEETRLPNDTRLDFTRDIYDQLAIFTDASNPNFVPSYDIYNPYKSSESPDCKKYRPSALPR